MNILLIEDDPGLGPILLRRLTRRGHQPILATTIARARSLLMAGDRYDLIVTDRDVPDGDAWAYVANYAAALKVRVVFMSARPPKDVIPPSFFFKGQDAIDKLWDLVEAL